jgi:hypothetical protein
VKHGTASALVDARATQSVIELTYQLSALLEAVNGWSKLDPHGVLPAQTTHSLKPAVATTPGE